MSGSKLGHSDSFNFEWYKRSSLSSTQQLDAFLDQYEEKYGLGNADKNLDTDSNNRIELAEKDIKTWKMAKAIKRNNDSYQTVTKLLRELQTKEKSKNSKHIFTKQSSMDFYTSSSSSEDGWDQDNDTFRPNQRIILPSYQDKKPSHERLKPNPKLNEKEAQLEAGRTDDESKSVMVAKQATKIPIVIDKSKNTNSFRKLTQPVKNHPLPSLEKLWTMESKNQILNKPCSPRVRFVSKVIDQQIVKNGEEEDASDISYTSDDNETVSSLLGEWLDHSKSVFKKILKIPESDEQQQQEKGRNHFMNNKKQEFQIGSILGAPYIPGMRHLPQTTFINPKYTSKLM